MQFAKRKFPEHKADMTPMIDMTFLLIAFFTVLVNFSEADQNQSITLPSSELAKPPEGPLELPIFLHVTRAGRVIFAGAEIDIPDLEPLMQREYAVLEATPGRRPADATVIIRADRNSMTGRVQEVIEVCQKARFEKFALRAKQEEGT